MMENDSVPVSLKGNSAALGFSKLEATQDIHKEYFLAGSNTVEANAFNGSIFAREYKMRAIVCAVHRVGAQLWSCWEGRAGGYRRVGRGVDVRDGASDRGQGRGRLDEDRCQVHQVRGFLRP
mmetsp:Transcript_85527/g.237025  ORF Transcript_85527/g.237025 Transcript_85527/m.237025 type:complete len:122 (+) Transcript_85527:322-687(+)